MTDQIRDFFTSPKNIIALFVAVIIVFLFFYFLINRPSNSSQVLGVSSDFSEINSQLFWNQNTYTFDNTNVWKLDVPKTWNANESGLISDNLILFGNYKSKAYVLLLTKDHSNSETKNDDTLYLQDKIKEYTVEKYLIENENKTIIEAKITTSTGKQFLAILSSKDNSNIEEINILLNRFIDGIILS